MSTGHFNAFQFVALSVVAILFSAGMASLWRRPATRKESFIWMLLWLATGTAIAWPRVTAVIARTLGIGRGADLVLYCAVLVMLIGFLMVYARLRRLNREVTLIVRHLAIQEGTTQTQATKS